MEKGESRKMEVHERRWSRDGKRGKEEKGGGMRVAQRRGEQSERTRNGEARGNERGARAALQYPTLDNGKHHLSVRPCDSVRASSVQVIGSFSEERNSTCTLQIAYIRSVDVNRTPARNRLTKRQVPRNFRENIRLIHYRRDYSSFQFGLPQTICEMLLKINSAFLSLRYVVYCNGISLLN